MNTNHIVVDVTFFSVCIPDREFRRIDSYLASLYTSFSRTSFQSMIERGCVTLNEEIISRSCKIRRGDKIGLRLEAQNMHISAEEIPLRIYFENNDFAIVEKEAGMNVHPVPGIGGNSSTLVNALLHHFQSLASTHSVLGGIARPGIVHRLDKDTSGMLIIAKNDRAMTALQKKMMAHSIQKRYLALVLGEPDTDFGTIESYLGRDPFHRTKITANNPIHPKFAKTDFLVQKKYLWKGQKYTLLELKLHTGRTHQIRVHCSTLGFPIIGDPLYGNSAINEKFQESFGLTRQFLHAYKLDFELFLQPHSFESPLPKDLDAVLVGLEKKN